MRAIALSLMLTALAFPALASQTVTLKPQVTASGPVTLGDLFDGAGNASGVVIAQPVAPGGSLMLDAATVQRAAMQSGLSWDNSTGLRRIIIRSGAGSSVPAAGNVQVLTYNRNLEAGEIVQAEDLSWAKLAGAPVGAPRDADALIGKAAKRPLREGSAASVRDVSNPQVIKAGDLVVVTYADDGISLNLQGKAMAPAAVGDTVAVMNLVSKKVIQAVASGSGQAVVGPEADALRAQAASSQFASR